MLQPAVYISNVCPAGGGKQGQRLCDVRATRGVAQGPVLSEGPALGVMNVLLLLS